VATTRENQGRAEERDEAVMWMLPGWLFGLLRMSRSATVRRCLSVFDSSVRSAEWCIISRRGDRMSRDALDRGMTWIIERGDSGPLKLSRTARI